MATYVCLMKLTDQGIKNIKNAPERTKEGFKTVEAMGGKVSGFYLTMGEYDFVAIAEFPNDEVGMTYLMGLGALGNTRTTTLNAFTTEQMAEMVANLPLLGAVASR
jgi:uncharacterized protein with GYD domain